MEKNMHLIEKKKSLLLMFMWLCWFFPYFYFDIRSYPQEKLKQSFIIIVILVVSTICYYLINNIIFKTTVFLISIISLTLILGINVASVIYPSLFIIFTYKNLFTKDKKNDSQNTISIALLCLVPILSILSIAFNFNSMIENLHLLGRSITLSLIFTVFFVFASKCPYVEKLKKNQKRVYKFICSVSVFGILASICSFDYMLNIGMSFFPWFFFITILVFEEDKILESSGEKLIEKLKKFLGIKNKKS